MVAGFAALFIAGAACGERSSNTAAATAAIVMVAFSLWFIFAQVRESDREQERQRREREAALARAQLELHEARERYQRALDCLDDDTGNLEFRKEALAAGRALAELARRQSGSTGRALFDEVELQNDLTIRIGTAAEPKKPAKCANCGALLTPGLRTCSFCERQHRI